MTVAIRRSTRVGLNSGVLLEDLGVTPTQKRYKMTHADVFNDNADLKAHAAALLKKKTVYALSGVFDAAKGKLTITTRNISRVDVYAAGRPLLSVDTPRPQTPVTIPKTAVRLALQGYVGDELVAAVRQVSNLASPSNG